MQFNSISFIFYFLPLFLAVYYVFPKSWRSTVLLLGSLAFYWQACGNRLWYLGLLAGMTLATYLIGLLLGRFHWKWLLGLCLSLMAGLLVFFKLWKDGSLLPPGLSFYLFQMTAYLADVYTRKTKPEGNILSYGAQTMMFPKLLSGPLAEPGALRTQSRKPCFCAAVVHLGLEEFILGLGMKVLLADRLTGLWAQAGVVGYESISTPFAWMALVAFALRLYLDFYGYSLMAVGLGHMLGYHLPQNFLQPYSAKTVSDFYRRWHATLGAWFRNYIYIPLGGNRKGGLRTIFNLAVVWLFTGFWHGVGGNYLLWAGFLFLLIVNERLWMGKLMNKSHVLGHVYTVFVIALSWVPFAIGNFSEMMVFLGRLFGRGGSVINARDYLIWGRDYAPLLAAGVIFATPLPKWLWGKLRKFTFSDGILFALFWVVVYFIATSAQDPFLYFQF